MGLPVIRAGWSRCGAPRAQGSLRSVPGRAYWGGWGESQIYDTGAATQLGQFQPPSDEVWGVDPDAARNLVLASDMPSGPWIIRPKGL